MKRAISAYIDSGFDNTHIANLPQLLDSVRGAFQMINANKLPAVTLGATEFMRRFVNREAVNPATDVQALETLADAMISIEYYLNELGRRHIADERILLVAEDSIATLQAFN